MGVVEKAIEMRMAEVSKKSVELYSHWGKLITVRDAGNLTDEEHEVINEIIRRFFEEYEELNNEYRELDIELNK